MASPAWPSWLHEILPSWLESTGAIFSGVGDGSDLRFVVSVGENGRWIGFCRSGWFYHANLEQYHFALKKEQTIVGVAGSGSVTESVSFRPSWGPVLLTGVTSGEPFTRHHNSFYPGTTLSYTPFATGSGLGLYTATIPSSSILIGMRNLTTLPLGSVAGTGLIISSNLYYYDNVNNSVYVKPKDTSNIEIWADILYTFPKLRMRELVIESDSGVLASYTNLEDLYVYRGGQSSYVGSVSGGFFTHTVTGVSAGDWLVLDYYIKKSFIVENHALIKYYTTASSGESFYINYEGTVPDTIRPLTLGASGSYYSGNLYLNQLDSLSHRAGYLFHCIPTVPASTLWSVSEIDVGLSKDTVCGDWGGSVKVLAKCLGDNELPVPWAPLSVHLSAGASALLVNPSLNRFDGRGEWNSVVTVSSGVDTFSVLLVSGAVSGQASGTVLSQALMIPEGRYSGGFVNLVVSDQRTQRGYQRTYVGNTYLDGVPNSDYPVVVRSKLSSIIDANESLNTGQATVTPIQSGDNIGCVIEIGYLPNTGDTIVALTGTGQSKKIEVSE